MNELLDPRLSTAALMSTASQNSAEDLPHSGEASAAAPDVATRIRYRICQERSRTKDEPGRLRECAEGLMGEWRRRVADGLPFDAFDGEAALAYAVAALHYMAAYGAGDFPAGLAGVQAVRQLATARLPAGRDAAFVFERLQSMETELSAKVPAAPRRRG